jgi:microcystin degradation protein MlrC|eukprot:COSAG03_NODE_452_length_7787_cov_30.352107_3_plen_72_part_00
MVAHGYDDVEGDLLSKVRAIVGPDCPIGAELDPHSHLTDLRFNSADILIAFKEFPHIDGEAAVFATTDYCR